MKETALVMRAVGAALLLAGAGHAQTQQPVQFVRDFCIKVVDGKAGELSTFMGDVTSKLIKARVDDGAAAWGVIARVVSPAGRTARCDYHVIYGYRDKLPEPPDLASTEAALKHAGLNMTGAEWAARRDSLSRLVSTETMRTVAAVEMPGRPAYVRMNHYKIRTGQSTASWVDFERSNWKPLVEAAKAEGIKTGWSANVVMMPQGEMVWSNAVTVDLFSDWDSAVTGIPSGRLWPKVHGNRSTAEWLDRLSTLVERQLVEIAHIDFGVPPKSAAAMGGTQ